MTWTVRDNSIIYKYIKAPGYGPSMPLFLILLEGDRPEPPSRRLLIFYG